MISNAVESGHKILLFSQFTTMLDHLAKRLEEEKISYYMLTGSTSKEKRAQMVENFNTDNTQVFCISSEGRRNRSESDGSRYCNPF